MNIKLINDTLSFTDPKQLNKIIHDHYIITNILDENEDLMTKIARIYLSNDIVGVASFMKNDYSIEIDDYYSFFKKFNSEEIKQLFFNNHEEKEITSFWANYGLINTGFNNFVVSLADLLKNDQNITPEWKGCFALHCFIYLGDHSDNPINSTFMDFSEKRDKALHFMENGGVFPILKSKPLSLLQRVDKALSEKLLSLSKKNILNREIQPIIDQKEQTLPNRKHKRKM